MLAADADLTDLRILVVDDLQVNRHVLNEQLSALGMRPDVVESASEAIGCMHAAVAAGDPYALAERDFQMPEMDGEQLCKAIKADPIICNTGLVLLTSAGSRGDAKRLRDVGFSGYLTKTTCRDTLRDVLATVWASLQSGRMDVRLVTRYTVAEARARAADPRDHREEVREWRVLLAEDNIVNQKVAKAMLEKLGCRVDVAANGKEAVELWSGLPYDVVFMDCQMPELDGYAATKQIRALEAGSRRTPIVAMTANAMEGDRERCLAVGMDDYIAKPVSVEDCRAALDLWGRSPHRTTGAHIKAA
jgi:CheY-like chemotaxis protein